MLRISAHLTQSPIVLHPQSSPDNNKALASLTGVVTITASKSRVIHGLEVLWVVCHQRRKDAKEKWGPTTQLEEFRSTAVEGEFEIEAGITSFEFMIQVPAALPPSRTTKYDRIFHTLNAATLMPAPGYASSSGSTFTLGLPNAFKRSGSLPTPFDKQFCSSTCSVGIEVFSAPEHADAQHTQFAWKEEAEGLGVFEMKASTDALALAAPVEIKASLSGLSDDIRIHAIAIELCQKVISPDLSFFYHDRYTLLVAGSALASINDGPELRIDGNVHLPSPVIGALPTAISAYESISTVTHTLEVTVRYSSRCLGPSAPKVWTSGRTIVVESDIVSNQSKPPPAYTKRNTNGTKTAKPVGDIDATKLQRWTSVHFLDRVWMRPVKFAPHLLKKSTEKHWEDTKGLCRCFDSRDTLVDSGVRYK